MVIQASVNGVSGKFLLDTGASFLTIKKSFAIKAHVTTIANSQVKLNTANGLSTGVRGVAAKVDLVRVGANNVPLIVQEDSVATYGQDIDGLLGISFLANFDVRFEGNSVKISTRVP